MAWAIAGSVNVAAGRMEQALPMLERVRAANPDSINARLLLADIYEERARHREARDVVQEILRVNPHLTVEAAGRMLSTFGATHKFKQNLRKAGLK